MASLAQQTVKNSFYGFAAYVVPIAFTIVITPLIIHRLGVEQYGLFVLTSIIAGFFSLFKFGLSYGVSKSISQYHGDRKIEGVSEVFSSSLALFCVIGTVGLLMSCIIARVGLNWFNITAINQSSAAMMFVFSGIAFLFSSINSVFINAIVAMQRVDIYTKIYLSGMLLLNGGMLLLVLAGFGVASLAAMQVVTNGILLIGYWFALRRLLPEIPLRPRYYHREFRKYIALNAYAYLHEAATTLLFEFDKILIATLSGPITMSYYSIAGTISQKIQGTVSSVTSIAMPISSSLAAAGDVHRIAAIYQRSMRVVLFVSSGLAFAAVGFGPAILRYWVGADFEKHGLNVLYILSATYLLLSMFTVFGHFVLGLGSVKKLAQYTVVFAVLNLILLAALLPTFGITGAAWAYLLCLIPLPFFMITTERQLLGIADSASFYGQAILRMAVMGCIGFIAARLALAFFVHSFTGVVIAGLIWLIGYALLYRQLKFIPDQDWEVLTSGLKRIIKRA